MLNLIHAYLLAGWKLFPIKAGDKVPATEHGVKDATNDRFKVLTWWEQCTYNVGLATGSFSGVVVLDIDGAKGINSLKMLEKEFGELSKDYVVSTPRGGFHYYFKAPTEALKNRVGIFPGIDFRADGGYVVAPPSIGKNGVEYKWVNIPESFGLDSLSTTPTPSGLNQLQLSTPSGLNQLQLSTPSSLKDFQLQTDSQQLQAPSSLKDLPEMPKWVYILVTGMETKESDLIEADGAVIEGHRNDYLFRMGCRLKRTGLSQIAIQDALRAENEERCLPPLTDREIAAIGHSVAKYKPSDPVSRDGDEKEPIETLIVTASSLIGTMCTYLRDKDKVKGQSLFIPELDRLMGGGLRQGELNIWHAQAKTGKNTVWHKLLHLQMLRGIPHGYASRELTPETEVMPNIFSIHFQENIWLSQNITGERFVEVSKDWPLYFCRGYGFLPTEQLRAWICALKRRGVNYFWFDHLHYMLEDPEDHKAASKLIKELKALTKEEDVCINLIVQPNKMVDGQHLGLNSLKGGSAIGQALDNLIILERTWNYENVMTLKLDAARSKLCKLGSLHLLYNPQTTDMGVVNLRDLEPINREERTDEQYQLTADALTHIQRTLFGGNTI